MEYKLNRIAIAFAGELNIARMSIDLGLLEDSFRELGIDSTVVCLPGCEIDYHRACVVAPATDWSTFEFWASLNCEVVLLFNWLSRVGIATAIKNANLKLISRADHEGICSARLHKREVLRRIWWQRHGLIQRASGLLFYLRMLLGFDLKWENEIIEVMNLSDAIIIESFSAKRLLGEFCVFRNHKELCEKIMIAPHPVGTHFVAQRILTQKTNTIVAIGRWDNEQKDPRLLLSVLQRFSSGTDGWKIVVVGSASPEFVADALKLSPIVEYVGTVNNRELVHILDAAKILLVTSRWEAGPIVVNEMLCSGGTIVHPPLPTIDALTSESALGERAASRTAVALANALETECGRWNRGERNANNNATYGQKHFAPSVVANQILRIAEKLCGTSIR